MGHLDAVIAIAFSPDSKTLASTSSDKIVRLWDLGSGAMLRKFFNDDPVYILSFSEDGTHLLIGRRSVPISIEPLANNTPAGFLSSIGRTSTLFMGVLLDSVTRMEEL